MALVEKVVFRLAPERGKAMEAFVRTGTRPAAAIRRAQVLLRADADGPDVWGDAPIGQTLGCSSMTAWRVRQQFAAEGLDATLHRRRPTGRQEAQLDTLACPRAPEGHTRWTRWRCWRTGSWR